MATDRGVRQRLYVAGVVAGLAAVAALALLILRFGERGASPPSLQAHPNPEIPGRIAYVNPQHCIVLIDAAGTSREELYCIGGPPLVVSWLDGRTVVFGEGFGQDVSLTAVDVETRATRPAGVLDAEQPFRYPYRLAESPEGDRAVVDSDGRVFVIRRGVRTEIADFDIGRSAWLDVASWSPDGEWLLLWHSRPGSEHELWIVRRDGAFAGTLVDDASGGVVSWWIDGKGAWPPLPTPTPAALPTPVPAPGAPALRYSSE